MAHFQKKDISIAKFLIKFTKEALLPLTTKKCNFFINCFKNKKEDVVKLINYLILILCIFV